MIYDVNHKCFGRQSVPGLGSLEDGGLFQAVYWLQNTLQQQNQGKLSSPPVYLLFSHNLPSLTSC